MYPDIELLHADPDIFRLHIPLKNSPLRYLNSYLIKTADRNLLIDTGFDRPECEQALRDAFSHLGIDTGKTDLFVTHLHGDHGGMMYKLLSDTSMLYFSSVEDSYLEYLMSNSYQESVVKRILLEGLPADVLSSVASGTKDFSVSQYERRPALKQRAQIHCLSNRDVFYSGGVAYRAIATPGHTPGHMCLYLEEEQLLFLGDQVLFDISPNIAWWPGVANSLKDYLASLETIKSLPVRACFVGHRENRTAEHLASRIDELILHHHLRLQEIEDCLAGRNAHSAYEIMQKLTWRVNGGSIEGSGPVQLWFALLETLAHIDYLVAQERIERVLTDESARYLIRATD